MSQRSASDRKLDQKCLCLHSTIPKAPIRGQGFCLCSKDCAVATRQDSMQRIYIPALGHQEVPDLTQCLPVNCKRAN